jgi:hypothetical protein
VDTGSPEPLVIFLSTKFTVIFCRMKTVNGEAGSLVMKMFMPRSLYVYLYRVKLVT